MERRTTEMKTFRVVVWSSYGNGDVTVDIEAPDGNTACQIVEDSMAWSYEEVEDDGDED